MFRLNLKQLSFLNVFFLKFNQILYFFFSLKHNILVVIIIITALQYTGALCDVPLPDWLINFTVYVRSSDAPEVLAIR